jgi:hypothetical protein
MRERDTALEQAVAEVAAILGDALVRLIFPRSFVTIAVGTPRRPLSCAIERAP